MSTNIEVEQAATYYDTNLDWISNPTLNKCARTVYPAAYKTYCIMEWIGGKVAYCIGATQSRFQYAIDEYNRLERRRLRKEEQERQMMLDKARRAGMAAEEEDSDVEDEDQLHIPYVRPVLTTDTVVPPPSAQKSQTGTSNAVAPPTRHEEEATVNY